MNVSSSNFQSLDLRVATAALERLFEDVVRRTGRVEITRTGSASETCVLITKRELDALERALDILASTEEGAAMRDTVLRAVHRLSPPTTARVEAAAI